MLLALSCSTSNYLPLVLSISSSSLLSRDHRMHWAAESVWWRFGMRAGVRWRIITAAGRLWSGVRAAVTAAVPATASGTTANHIRRR